MKVIQTIELEDNERLAIQRVLGICDEVSNIAHCSMADVFEYLAGIAEIVDDHKYSIGNMLYIAEIG